MIKIFSIILAFVFIIGCSDGGYPSKNNPQITKLKQKAYDYYNQKEYKKAIRVLDKVIRLDPENSIAYSKRGDCYRKLRKPRQAIKDYTKAIKYNKGNARAYYHRGTLLYKLGKKKQGCEDVAKARQMIFMPAEKFYNEYCK